MRRKPLVARKRNGMTLIEVLTSVALFGFIVSMAGPLMFDFRKANEKITRSLEHVRELDWLNGAFRADLAKAREIAREYRDFELGPRVLILRSVPFGVDGIPDERKEEYVVYWVDPEHPARLARTFGCADGSSTASRIVAKDLEAVEFFYGPKGDSDNSHVELRMTFKKGIIHKNKPMFYGLSAWVGE
jgi:prepilin-type N-terminal cleavage/methylation domain-containing protein